MGRIIVAPASALDAFERTPLPPMLDPQVEWRCEEYIPDTGAMVTISETVEPRQPRHRRKRNGRRKAHR